MAKINAKLEYWKSRLLDLGKRNRLINCPLPKSGKHISRSSLLISQPDYINLWSLFSENGQALEFPVPSDSKEDEDIDENLLGVFCNGVATNQTPNETHKTLRSLMKKAKEFSEEKGLNALYLAFGFLNWKENGKDGQEMRAPLLLVPVKLVQEDLFSPILLSRLDEEITANYSLEQKLNGDFGIELPDFSDDTDLSDYLDHVRKAVVSLGWSVSTDVTQLALFSFMKINMYRDLERNADKIMEHHIVRALNGEAFNDGVAVSDIADYKHDSNEPQEVFSVVDADSSQQDAILLAKRGASFVLQGPPGTGKSQTITNIIAELIADGKKVLFVSEKRAALEVVYKRVSQAGLADFCLTLHNHNAKRREILDQFERSLKMSRQRVSLQQDAYDKLYRLKETRNALNRYSEELHTVVEPLGKTVYQVNGFIAQRENYVNIDYVQVDADMFTSERLAQCEIALEELATVVEKSGYQQNNPWKSCVLTDPPTHIFRQRFKVDSENLAASITEGLLIFGKTSTLLDLKNNWSYASIDEIERIFAIAERSPQVPPTWISLDLQSVICDLENCTRAVDFQSKKVELDAAIKAFMQTLEVEGIKYDDMLAKWQAAHNDLLTSNDENILQIDAGVMLGLYRNEYRTWLRGFIAGFRNAQKTLLSYRKTADKFSYAEGLALLDKIATVQRLKTEVEKQLEIIGEAKELLSNIQREYAINDAILAELQYSKTCDSLSTRLGLTIEPSYFMDLKVKAEWALEFQTAVREAKLGDRFVTAVCEKTTDISQKMQNNLSDLWSWKKAIKPHLDTFAALFAEERKQTFYSLPLRTLSRQLTACADNLVSLENLVDYRNAERKLTELGVNGYIEKAKKVNLSSNEIVEVFKKCFYRSWLDAVIPHFPAINEFRSLRQDERVELFKSLDKSHLEISKAILISRLISNLPNFDAFGSNGEVALLRREMAKQRKLMPIRKLIAALPNLLPALKPCVMMSPLSVSTYFGDSSFEFDTVIFDEASQVRTEDAIGAIFRAKQVIIAGDSKQLPPTDFFSSSMSNANEFVEEDEEEIDDTGAYESLLDEGTLLPTQTLRWHYRSRHEHLIAFSNTKIYQGNLITFPSSVEKSDGMGVEYVHVSGGIYDRGGKNGNKAEAARVAELAFEHFEKYPNRSLGIIAFGEVQQSAIQDALIEKRRANPMFEPFFKEDKEESLFIKNLETVQGDERDTIIFSIGYAPDATGKFIMNFGPLSRNGGERRLNVAVTRARYNMKLVGSILPTDIDSERTSGQGPKLLRLYIDFAINGANAILGEITAENTLCFDSPFELSVYNFLTGKGFNVATQVGCSGYRIDMAVRHPKYNGRFAIGIECDGAMYHSARTARERDRLRQTVLEDMGWKIYRVWSTDWIKDQHAEGVRLVSAIEQAIDNHRETIPSSKAALKEKVTDFLNVQTVSVDESIREGIHEKVANIRSRYFGLSAKEISTRDFVETMLKVLQNNFGLDKAGLFKETSLYGYGWERQGSAIKQKLELAFAAMLQSNKIEEEEGKIKLK